MTGSRDVGETISYQLRRLRRLRGLTQEELADRAGVSRDLVAKLEQGRRHSARIASLASLARALDVELSALVERAAPALDIGDPWRTSPEMAADLETLVGSYRQAYAGRTPVTELRPAATGLTALLTDLRRRDQYARDGDETTSGRFLSRAFAAMERTRDDPAWKGVGWFDEPRLVAYEGGNLLLLGRYAAAEELLRGSLARLHPARVKHRCTLSADLALTLAHRGEIEESCMRAADALSLARSIAHQESVERVRAVHGRLLRWREHAAVRELTEQLAAA